MKKLISHIILVFAILALMVGLTPSVQAAPSGLYLNPLSGTYQKGSSFNAQLRLGGSSTSGVQANMYFDVSRLQVTSMSNQGSSFGNVTNSYDNTAGRIIVYAVDGNGSGDRLITTVTFRGIGAGTTAVTFSGTNTTLSYLLLVPVWTSVSTTNASYTITAPAAPPVTPPAGGGTTNPGSGSTGGNSGSSPTPKPGVTKPSANPGSAPTPAPTPSAPAGDTPKTDETPDEAAKTQIKENLFPEFETTPPNAEPWESSQPDVPASAKLAPWLPVITAAGLGLLMVGIFVGYRRTHMTNALARLMTATVSYRIALSERTSTSTFPRILPMLAGAPKLIAYTAPKLLASGVKKVLLLTAGTSNKPKSS